MASEQRTGERQAMFPFSMLERMRFPQLFVLLLALFVVDLFVLDPIPFLDELVLGILTLMAGSWGRRERAPRERIDKEPEKNVTPPG